MADSRIESFDELPLSFALLRGLRSVGWHSPSEYQKQEMRKILTSKCLLSVARSGSGKSSALMIAALHEVLVEGPQVQSLILVDSRECAQATCAMIRLLAAHIKGFFPRLFAEDSIESSLVQIEPIVGRILIRDTTNLIKQLRPQILVGTPGRTLDMVKRGCITFENLKFFAINCAQDCLEIGFGEQIEELVQLVPPQARKVVTNYCRINGPSAPLFDNMFPKIELSIPHESSWNSGTNSSKLENDPIILNLKFVDFTDTALILTELAQSLEIDDIGVIGSNAVQKLYLINALQKLILWPIGFQNGIVFLNKPIQKQIRKLLVTFDSISKQTYAEATILVQVSMDSKSQPADKTTHKHTKHQGLLPTDAIEFLRTLQTGRAGQHCAS